MVSDFFLSETAAAGGCGFAVHAMGRRRRHDDQSGRPYRAAAASVSGAGPGSVRRGDSRSVWPSVSIAQQIFRPTRKQLSTNCGAHRRAAWPIMRGSHTSASAGKTACSGRARASSIPGRERLFLDRFGTEDGRARFHAVECKAPAEEPDAEFPLYLTTGRVMAQYQSGTQTRRVKSLRAAMPEAFVEIHPAMARSYGIEQGDLVWLTTRRGTASMKARLTASIRLDTVFVPFHFAGEERANLLTNPALDRTSRMPEFKVCAARISKGRL